MGDETDLEYLAARVKRAQRVDGMTECWEWALAPSTNGYGLWKRRDVNREMLAHRVAYSLHVGPIPDGLTLDHLCRNRICVNPEHLEPVTARVNARRGKDLSDDGYSLFHRANGLWVARIERGSVDGRRQRKEFTSRDRSAVEAKAQQFIKDAPPVPSMVYARRVGERRPGPRLTPKAAAFLEELRSRREHAAS